jgi:hypothetical protein
MRGRGRLHELQTATRFLLLRLDVGATSKILRNEKPMGDLRLLKKVGHDDRRSFFFHFPFVLVICLWKILVLIRYVRGSIPRSLWLYIL